MRLTKDGIVLINVPLIMQRDIVTTKDGSHTISVPELNVTYHSIHGALQESLHVFIQAGLHFTMDAFPEEPLRVLEVGFGTGLNAWLTLQESAALQRPVHYTSLELYPLDPDQAAQLNYTGTNPDLQKEFLQLHSCEWEKDVELTQLFTLLKRKINLLDFSPASSFHVVYFDAFAPGAQPGLWTTGVFAQLYNAVLPAGILVTYCSKGDVRRAMTAAGWQVEKIPGPPGKREMVRAHKNVSTNELRPA